MSYLDEYNSNLSEFLTEKLTLTEYRTSALRCIAQAEMAAGASETERTLLAKAQVYATLELARVTRDKK